MSVSSTTFLSAGDLAICDDLIPLLGKKNLRPMIPDSATRAQLWEKVFENEWNTDCCFPKPAPLAALKIQQTAVEAGTLRQGCTEHTTSRKRSSSGALVTRCAEARRQGKPAWLKAFPTWDEGGDCCGIQFKWFDDNGQPLASSQVQLNEGMTIWSARASAIKKRNECELERVGGHNLEMVVHWARNRLTILIARRTYIWPMWQEGVEHVAVSQVRQLLDKAVNIGIGEQLSELKQIRLCSDLLQGLSDVPGDCLVTRDADNVRGVGLDA